MCFVKQICIHMSVKMALNDSAGTRIPIMRVKISCPNQLDDKTKSSRIFGSANTVQILGSDWRECIRHEVPNKHNAILDEWDSTPSKGEESECNEKGTINAYLTQKARKAITTATNWTTLRILTHLSSFHKRLSYCLHQRIWCGLLTLTARRATSEFVCLDLNETIFDFW